MTTALSDTDVKRFQTLYKARFNVTLDKDAAYRKLSLLVLQMKTVYQPITSAQAANYANEEEENNEQVKSEQHS